MGDRLGVAKTYKLFIGGKFPRTESGRTTKVEDAQRGVAAHVCRASRKDVREAVEAARKAQRAWAGATAYLRGQILYRIAEMLESRRAEFAEVLTTEGTSADDAQREIDGAIDRAVAYAGWTDKFTQVWGGANPVAGPYHNFTVPGPVGVVAVIAPDERPLLGLVTLALGPIAMGSTVLVLASEANPIPAMVLAEALATSDVPAGVVNILTGFRDELIEHVAGHREIDAVHAAGVSAEHRQLLREGAAENLKRVTVRDTAGDAWFDDACASPWWIEPFVESKTTWHPSAT
ncbi:MAG: aldehyde dehydrogenase [Phycisphaeraceae bacterium]|nr:MAG: aldehyde dehydrogenase [Phycisphaeraceae bacterium]